MEGRFTINGCSSSPPRPRAPAREKHPGIAAWTAYALLAVSAAALVTWLCPMWFRDDDGIFLGYVARHPLADAFRPSTGTVFGCYFRPLYVAAFWAGYHTVGLTYWPYQFAQVLLTFAMWAAFFVMLRRIWGSDAQALTAAMLHPLLFASLYYFTFRFSQVNFQLELLLAFSAVAAAARGWQRRNVCLLVAAVLLTEMAYAAKEPACIYLPVLHIWTAVVLGRRAGARTAWIAAWLLAVLALTGWHVWLVRSHLRLLGAAGGPRIEPDFVLGRVRYYADVLRAGRGGIIFCGLTALACGVQVARIPPIRRWRWVLVPLSAAAGAAVFKFAHPLVPVLAVSLPVPTALPFALAALVVAAALAQLQLVWPIYAIELTWLIAAALTAAIFHSPLPQLLRAADALCRRRIRFRLGVAGALVPACVLAFLLPQILRNAKALRVTSWRRRIARDLTRYLAANAPTGATIAVADGNDIAMTDRQRRAMPYLPRANSLAQWPPACYSELLVAHGRGDLSVVNYRAAKDRIDPGLHVLATSRREIEAAEGAFSALPSSVRPVLLKFVRHGRQSGKLWRLRAWAQGRSSRQRQK